LVVEQDAPNSLWGCWTIVDELTLFAMLAAVDKNFLTLVLSDIKGEFGFTNVQINIKSVWSSPCRT
jgi:hypothetical protein